MLEWQKYAIEKVTRSLVVMLKTLALKIAKDIRKDLEQVEVDSN